METSGRGISSSLRKLSKRRSQRVSQSVDRALRPDVSEDESGHDQTKKNSNDAIADIIEVCIGRITLEDAVEKSERYLQTRVGDEFCSGGDPAGNGRGTGHHHNQRRDCVHVRHEEDDGEQRECSADHTAADPEDTLVQRCTGAFQRDESAGDQRGVDSRPVNRHINDVAEHRCEGDFEREVHMRGISERVRTQKSFSVLEDVQAGPARPAETASSARR